MTSESASATASTSVDSLIAVDATLMSEVMLKITLVPGIAWAVGWTSAKASKYSSGRRSK